MKKRKAFRWKQKKVSKKYRSLGKKEEDLKKIKKKRWKLKHQLNREEADLKNQ